MVGGHERWGHVLRPLEDPDVCFRIGQADQYEGPLRQWQGRKPLQTRPGQRSLLVLQEGEQFQ